MSEVGSEKALRARLEELPRTIWWEAASSGDRPAVCLIDQTRLPFREDVRRCHTLEDVEGAIQSLALRGAPVLGVAAALALALWSENESGETDVDAWLVGLDIAAARIAQVRPTAVNLAWGAERMRAFAHTLDGVLDERKAAILDFALRLVDEDEAVNRALGAKGAELLKPQARVLTHCNTGSLATVFFGTALGVVYSAYDQGRVSQVWVCETRPLNQGGRLTTWELMRAGIPCTLIADDAAASLMAAGEVDAVLVGADRICANGDAANKIGTLALAIAANHYHVPFYVCAPLSTFDATLKDGSQIPIERRASSELQGFGASGVVVPDSRLIATVLSAVTGKGKRSFKLKEGHRASIERVTGGYAFDTWLRTTPQKTRVYNPAFDVTPASLISSFVTETGVYAPHELESV
ncbi:MAG: S-methyl-5-thioribose-1-phosphate isomerase [Coriobacteriales bacterium]|jgi:methylthioribose-1-phosphate isomerase|nr:S-methyl-5-thioribose-1-phosphate isomerase [Coriobacteriales bacterium]